MGAAPNGGYLLAIALRGLQREVSHPDPFTVTAHFLTPCAPGPAEVDSEVLRVGRSHSTAVARLVQDSAERVRVTATFGDLTIPAGPTEVTIQPPDMPDPDRCATPPPGIEVPEIARRFDLRLEPGTAGWAVGRPSGRAEIGGWVRFADGREPDALSLVLFADAFPPAILNTVGASWVPTLELTVHVRARPAEGWLRAWFRTRALIGGYLEEDGEIWDAAGQLVAMSRQLARVHA